MLSLLVLIGLAGGQAPDIATRAHEVVREAIVDAVRRRVGAGAEVIVDDLRVVDAIDGAPIVAVPDTGARAGREVGFTLRQSAAAGLPSGGRTGRARARVRVVAAHAHAARAIDRGAWLTPDDTMPARHEIDGVPLAAVPDVATASRGRALRAIAPGDCLVRGAVLVAAAVRTGDEVTAFVAWAGARVGAALVALQSGDAGALIRVANPASRRALQARVVAPGVVEVVR